MERGRRLILKNVRAQSMVEVAIFGSIIIFLVGAIVKNIVTTSFAQQYGLRTMREALTEASKKTYTSISYDKGKEHKPYNLVIIEDRLLPGVAKFGITERAPYIASSYAVFSPDLFQDPYITTSTEKKDLGDVPELNMRINGEKRTYTLGKWVEFKDTVCDMFFRQDPSAGGVSWIAAEEPLKEVIDADGRALCYVESSLGGKYPTPVFREDFTNPPKYWMMDPTAGDINPYDPTQGLQQDSSIVTTNNAKLNVPADGKKSYSRNEQTDVIARNIKKNNQVIETITTKINGPAREHQW